MGGGNVETEPIRGAPRGLTPFGVLRLAAWCGLAAGELEVAVRVAQRNLSSTDRLYLMTRHFVWLVPVLNLLMFLALGAICAVATWRWPRRGGWLSSRLIVATAVLPSLLLVGPGIHAAAWLVFAIGLAVWLGPLLERSLAGSRRWRPLSFAVLATAVLIQGGWLAGADALARRREGACPIPPAGSPNVLLVVLDTVRADHLSAYRYERPTTPSLERLARQSIRFDQARAAAPWTLASHACLFTGETPHKLDVRWMWPLRGGVPTLAEFLGSLGYATAGFVGNTFYCAYDSGLNRGFTHYEDYELGGLSALRTVRIADLALSALAQLGPALGRSWSAPTLFLRQFTHGDRKDAALVNREFLTWLDGRRGPRRPFFAFLNYVDAHAPYVLPPGVPYRFGTTPGSTADFLFLLDGWFRVDKTRLSRQAVALARDSYDSCLAYLDGQLGELLDELERRGELGQTIVIVTADHGEGFGEHDLFDHGESLYRTEIRVPLLIRLPSGEGSGRVVDAFVSLCDIPATIAELVAPGRKSPFPRLSLTGTWTGTSVESAEPTLDDVAISELSAPNPLDPNYGRSPARKGPLRALAAGDFVYIRNEADGKEELFNERDDPRELVDRGRSASAKSVLEKFRLLLRQLGGPTSARAG